MQLDKIPLIVNVQMVILKVILPNVLNANIHVKIAILSLFVPLVLLQKIEALLQTVIVMLVMLIIYLYARNVHTNALLVKIQ